MNQDWANICMSCFQVKPRHAEIGPSQYLHVLNFEKWWSPTMVNLVCRKLSIWFHRDLDMQNRKLQEFRLLVPPAIAQWFWDICAFLSMGLYNLLTHNFRTGYDYDWFLPVPAPQPIQKRRVVYGICHSISAQAPRRLQRGSYEEARFSERTGA